MKVNPEQLRDDGYIILREVIPPEQLDDVRASFEVLVERQKEIWAQEGNPSVWETGAQPRLGHFENLIDEDTANAVETWMHKKHLGGGQPTVERSRTNGNCWDDVDVQPTTRSRSSSLAPRCSSHRHGTYGESAIGLFGEWAQICPVEYSALRR